MKKARVSSRCGNMVKVAAIIAPWLCALALPALRLEGFVQSVGRCVFFECVIMPFGNVALLGLLVDERGLLSWGCALCAFAGIVAPVAIAFLFALCWRRWQFALVWLAYVALVAWDALVASFLAYLIAVGGFVV